MELIKIGMVINFKMFMNKYKTIINYVFIDYNKVNKYTVMK